MQARFLTTFRLTDRRQPTGAAAVLYQEIESQRKVVSYGSLRFNQAEQRYHINKQECLALI